MKKTLSIPLVSIMYIVAIVVGGLLASPAYGCACGILIPQKFQDIAMKGERGLVIFDSIAQKEQMAIDFQMVGNSSNSALIVPTPVKSEISQIKKVVFDDIWDIIKPDIENSDSKSTPLGSSVQVLERKVVGSFEIAVLKTNSYDDLDAWTTDNGFYLQAEARGPVEAYIDKGFVLNVIKLEKNATESDINPLLFTFGTSRLFYPLMEIEDDRNDLKDKSLSLFIITNEELDLYSNNLSPKIENKEVSKNTLEDEITKAEDPEFSDLVFTSDKYYVNYITSLNYSADESLAEVLGNSTSATDMSVKKPTNKTIQEPVESESPISTLLIYAAIIVPSVLVAGSVVYIMKRTQAKQQSQPTAYNDSTYKKTEPLIEPEPEAPLEDKNISNDHDFVIPEKNSEDSVDQDN